MKEKIQKWAGKAVSVLLDTHTPDARGGTGETFDWTIASGYILFNNNIDFYNNNIIYDPINTIMFTSK